MRITRRRIVLFAMAALAAITVVFAFRPEPVSVDTEVVSRGALLTTIDDDGLTRVPERYEIASPIAGRKGRIQSHAGDPVKTGDLIVDLDPVPIDPRQEAELTARLSVARDHARDADAAVRRVSSGLDQARRDRARAEELATAGVAPRTQLEQARTTELELARELDSARFRAQAAGHEVEVVRAALSASGGARHLEIRSPVDGRILRVHHESEGVIPAGALIMEIGDPSRLEVVIDVLSSEGVRVKPGQSVLIDRWGGEGSLQAEVVRVEPSAFTKVSVLGVEEQRVNVIADISSPPPELGDRFQVDARIVIQRGDVLKVPDTALFRAGAQWAVFIVRDGRARLQPCTIGRRGSSETEIVEGLRDGERVIIHPSEELADGVRVIEEDPAAAR